MGNSLQDQLLKAGLANKKQALKARKAQHNKQKQKSAGKLEKNETELLVEKTREEQVAKDRELNRIKQAEAEAKAVQAQIKQLIDLNKIEERGDVEFSFTHGSNIKSLALQTHHKDALVIGKLAIVNLNSQYAIVPTAVADKIAQRDESLLVLRNTASEDTDTTDDYAEYQVPDDLMW